MTRVEPTAVLARSQPPDGEPPRRRRAAGWVAIVVALVVVGIAGTVLSGVGRWSERDALDPDSAGPQGTRALAQILRQHGIEVTVARSRDGALAALAGRDATLVLADSPLLSDDRLREVADAATDVVLIDPRARGLRVLLPGSYPDGVAPGTPVAPSCALETARRAGPVTPGVVFGPAEVVTACYPVDGSFGLLTDESAGVTAIDGRALFTNEHLADAGNAALGIGLLGAHPTVVWYVPAVEDADGAAATQTLGDLTPPWVSPVVVLLLAAAVAAAIWRGRRFGPLVLERLPVTVRASETTEGRARLYARARDSVHAADQVRIGAAGRLARMLGLGPAASAAEIADAAAARLNASPTLVRGILIDELPATDAELVALSDRLRDLEAAVRNAVRPERNRP
ncbi:DUF4350 domain-containing protein [Microbacterium rhizomatis]|uniref:DUF4350 domain-containing protein n=1 Tax=Microbacterium rhizomatis TaxID=1631477 RepID=A0A5J5J4S5_9MICO|nr:DUF4350 domain-containing protein [Microbacterium rhizomatis]KAA9111207.1 DUF4350 domain-containing protein [Microbacterium rhizomatis]